MFLFTYYIGTGYVTIKGLKYVKINSVNRWYITFSKTNAYFEEINGNRYLTVVPTNERIKKYEESWRKIRELIRSITKNADDYDEKHMKIRFSSDNKLPLNKTIETPTMTIVVRVVFHENNKIYNKSFLKWMTA